MGFDTGQMWAVGDSNIWRPAPKKIQWVYTVDRLINAPKQMDANGHRQLAALCNASDINLAQTHRFYFQDFNISNQQSLWEH